MAAKLLQALLNKYGVGTRSPRHRRFLVGTLFGANTKERRSFEQVALLAGASSVDLVAEPLAAAIGAGLPIQEPRASMIVDVGGGATEALVLSLKNVVSGGSIRIGGDAMNEAIMQFLHRHMGLDVGRQEAKRLKETITSPLNSHTYLEAKGFDVRQRCPRVVQIRVGDLLTALQSPFIAITEMVKDVINRLAPELHADLMEQGITLTGGGAAIEALRTRLEAATNVSVKPLPAPQQAVINGCGQMLCHQ